MGRALSAPRRLVFIGDLGSKNRTGGGYTFAQECVDTLFGAQVCSVEAFIITCPRIDRGTTPSPPGSKLINLPDAGLGKAWVAAPLIWKLTRCIQEPPDLYFLDQPIAGFRQLPKAPAICMFHGPMGAFDLSWRHPRNSINTLLMRHPTRNLTHEFLTRKIGLPLFNSRYSLEALAAEHGVDPAPLTRFITYLPVDTFGAAAAERRRMAVRSELGIAGDQVLISYVANFSPVKRVDLAVLAAREILAKRPEVRILFAGRPIAAEALSTLGSDLAGTRNRVIIHGEVSPLRASELRAASDIAISTSECETFGYAVAEGMAAGVPHVVYPGGALTELVEDGVTGRVVTGHDGFVQALLELIDRPETRHRLGKAAKAAILLRFSRAAFKKRLLEILDEAFVLPKGR